jgi:hypothetical protein
MSSKMINLLASQIRIRRIAVTVKWAAITAMAGIVSVAGYSLVNRSLTWKATALSTVTVHASISQGATDYPQFAVWLDLLPEAALLYGLFRLVQMMQAYERGEIFSSRVSTHLQAFSLAIIAVELLNITQPLQVAALRALAGYAIPEFSMSATGEQLWSLLLAALFLVLAQILKESARVAEDSASII